jgi:hypothetical protein
LQNNKINSIAARLSASIPKELNFPIAAVIVVLTLMAAARASQATALI